MSITSTYGSAVTNGCRSEKEEKKGEFFVWRGEAH